MLENPSSLMLFAIILPIILLYLLKPKPRPFEIPSLMLLLPDMRKMNLRSLFKTLVRDPLLLIQLITISLLILSLANPYFSGNVRSQHTVIVLDSSASMAARDVSPDRFSQAVDIAREYVRNSDRVSLILAQNTPLVLLKEAQGRTALDMLSHLIPKATGTDMNSAMLLAAGLFGNDKAKLVVISDFSGQDIIQSRKIIEAKGIAVEYRQVGSGGSNTGIVDTAIQGNDLKIYVKNYGDAGRDIRINLINNDHLKTFNRTLKPGSREFIQIPNISTGRTIVEIEPHDELRIDDTLYVSMPSSNRHRALLISDSVNKKAPVSVAFNSIPSVEVDEISFDRAPRTFDYDIVVLHDYTRNSPLPGTMDDLRIYVERGGTLVFVAERELQYMDTGNLLPVNVSGVAKLSRFKVRNDELTKDIDLGISGYMKAELREGAVELASGEEGPVLAYLNTGKGKVVYLGINDEGEFHLLPSYPVFWFNLLNFATSASTELNVKTGTLLHKTGFYKIDDKTIASNLLDEKESDISIKGLEIEDNGREYGKNIEKTHIGVILSIIAILFITFELYYLKNRGDI